MPGSAEPAHAQVYRAITTAQSTCPETMARNPSVVARCADFGTESVSSYTYMRARAPCLFTDEADKSYAALRAAFVAGGSCAVFSADLVIR